MFKRPRQWKHKRPERDLASVYGSNLLDVDSTKSLVSTSRDPIRRWESLTSSISPPQYLPMYRSGFIYNLTIPKPVKNEQFDRVINGDAVRHFVTLAHVETGGRWWFNLRAIYVLEDL
jgi:hypothetical protein